MTDRQLGGRARSGAVAALLLLGLVACGGPDQAAVVDELDWPASWDLVLATEDDDTSCGDVRCPTSVRYFGAGDDVLDACEDAAALLGVDARQQGRGCAVERCQGDVFLTVSINEESQRVHEGVEAREIEAPPDGAAIAARARAGC